MSETNRAISELINLRGRSALITGGCGHIGRAVGEGLAELGAKVSILDTNADACNEQATVFAKYQEAAGIGIACDLRNEVETRAAVHKVVESTGGLDIIVHCAAYVGTTEINGWAVPFEEQTVEAWDEAIRVNLTSAFVLAQEGKEALSASGHGTIIFFGSIYGLVGPDLHLYEGTSIANPMGYGASKGGLLQLTRYLATVLAPDVRVNAISPAGLWRNQPEVFHERAVKRTPLNRMAREEDFKGAVAYLASDLSAYVTGHNLMVDGGWSVW